MESLSSKLKQGSKNESNLESVAKLFSTLNETGKKMSDKSPC